MDIQIIIIFTAALLFNTMYTVVAPFYPLLAEKRELPKWLIGLIFVTMPVASFSCTPILTKCLSVFGYRKVIAAGVLLSVSVT